VIRRFFTTDMTEFKDQIICIKCCFNLLKKTAAETHRMPQMPSEIIPRAKAKLLNGTNASRTDERLSTTMSVLDDRRLVVSIQIIASQRTNSVSKVPRNQSALLKEVTPFCCSAFAVGTATGLRTGRSGVRIPGGAADFSLLQIAQTSSGTNPTPFRC
jgi:hypothetical protein